MKRTHKGGIIGDYIAELGMLTQDQKNMVGKEQNQGMLSWLKKEDKISSKEIESLSKIIEKTPSIPFPEAIKLAGLDNNKPEFIPPFNLRFGTLAKKYAKAEDVELANAIQAADTIERYVSSGLKKEEKAASRNYIQTFAAPDKEPWIEKATGLTQRVQAAASVTSLLYNAIEVGGKEVADLKEVKKAEEAALKLAYIYRKEEIKALEKAGFKDAAEALSEELKEMKQPGKHDTDTSLLGILAKGVKAACNAIGLKSVADKLEQWLDKRLFAKLENKYTDQLLSGAKASMDKLRSQHNSNGVKVDEGAESWLEKRKSQLKNQPKDVGPAR